MNTAIYSIVNKLYLLIFIILCNNIIANGQTLNNNRNGLVVNVKYNTTTKTIYYDFNSLADSSENGYKTNEEIRAYLKAYPEMLEEDAVADKVAEKYPDLFQEARKEKFLLLQETERKKKLNNK